MPVPILLIGLCSSAELPASDRRAFHPAIARLIVSDCVVLGLNNHFMMHERSEYKDSENWEERRHLRRLWLETSDWEGKRSGAMAYILVNARNNWEKNDVGVQMWGQR